MNINAVISANKRIFFFRRFNMRGNLLNEMSFSIEPIVLRIETDIFPQFYYNNRDAQI